jgi:hypothetical protein
MLALNTTGRFTNFKSKYRNQGRFTNMISKYRLTSMHKEGRGHAPI